MPDVCDFCGFVTYLPCRSKRVALKCEAYRARLRARAPVRIQRKRTKGWRMPDGAIYVGRPGKWGNDYRPGQKTWHNATERFEYVRDVEHAVRLYREMWEHWLATDTLVGGISPWTVFEPLQFHDLACWCPLDRPCHADVLLELANRC